MEPVQAIIVLGRGIDLEGNLPANARTRVERAVSLYDELKAPLIFTGRWSYKYTEQVPPLTEAAAMAIYAQSLGVPESACLLEEESKDTIGNAFFCKTRYFEPYNWRSFCVVTSVDHAERTEFIFKKVFGPEYFFNLEECSIGTDQGLIERSLLREQRSLTITKQLLDSIPDGDDEEVDYLVHNVLFAYAEITTLSREELASMLDD